MNESKQSKQSNKKNNKKGKGKENEEKSAITVPKFLFVFMLVTVLSAGYMYKVLLTPPELPKVDMNEYWGPYPMDLEPDLSIRPFEIEFSDVMIHDLRERLLHRRPFVPPLENTGFTYGFNTNFLTRVLDYWKNNYNFKDREQFFNKYNHFKTKIQGLDIHYIHVKPKVTDDITVVPLLMMHGWPGSVREFYEIIPKLTNPVPEHNFVFELIIPSIPGYGFSQGAVRPGLSTSKMAIVMANLMKRVGHEKYYVQGGDVGHSVGSVMATLFPDKVLGFHTNFPTVSFNSVANLCIFFASVWPSLIVEPELKSRMYPLSDHASRILEESGYMHIQATKPDTIGAALTDTPAGLAAYILEKFSTWTNPEYKTAGDGKLHLFKSNCHLLDNVMVYWVTNSITTSVRAYAESLNKKELDLKFDEIPTLVPTWGIKFKHELIFHPDSMLRLKYKNYFHSTVVEDGGHFAAFENPTIMATDIYQAVDTFRQFHDNGGAQKPAEDVNYKTATTIYEFTVKDINGKNVKLDKYKGNVLIIVNVASECGLTDTNYKQLNELYEKYSTTKNLRILAFPCNQFAGQEPGNNKDILNFVKNRGVKFDLFEKIDVNGENAHPLYKFLKKLQTGTFGDFIKWNFSKFIIDKNGVPVERLGPNVNPIDMEPLLAKYW
ncbi:Juvenile hormone epoxide hydrolase [Papilio machaon]|uniref:Glutathione peroxidase n=1 Tax=Papilio machaon TaxID=76193 RepID=A0A0N0PD06_PAPMA|nr:Juvenile hormone epoxide hydrolase [Papilio machaon]